jgi:hypothetical protein
MVACAVTTARGPIPATDASHPFLPHDTRRSLFEESGYVEEEFFVSGESRGPPYTTHILVRRPARNDDFSGVVFVEPLHPAGSCPVWNNTAPYILGGGHAWVEVAHSDTVANGVVRSFDPERYAPIEVSNSPVDAGDIIGQVGTLLRNDAITLGAVERIALIGNSNTGAVVREYISIAHHRYPGTYDGFFPVQTAVSTRPTPIPDLDVPVLELQGESEVIRTFERGFPSLAYRRPNSDVFRLWEVPGMPHYDQTENPPFRFVCEQPLPSSFPMPAVWRAALDALVTWMTRGIPAPEAELIRTTDDGRTVVRDDHGNALGGVPTLPLRVPRATYRAVNTNHPTLDPPEARCDFVGYEVPFTRSELTSLYGDDAGYVAAVDRTLDDLVAGRWLLQRDADELRSVARRLTIR